MKLMEAVSIRLFELLKERKWTAYYLSKRSGVDQATISDIKHQNNVGINLRLIYELSEGLDIDLATFFDSPLFRDDNIVD